LKCSADFAYSPSVFAKQTKQYIFTPFLNDFFAKTRKTDQFRRIAR
jgi:hypothetical protein